MIKLKEKIVMVFKKFNSNKRGHRSYLLGMGLFFLHGFFIITLGDVLFSEIFYIGGATLFILGVCIDLYEMIDISKRSTLIKIALFIFFSSYLYFSFYVAESFAKAEVYEHVHENPEFFPTSTSILTGLYLLPGFAFVFFYWIEEYAIFLVICLFILMTSFMITKIFDNLKLFDIFRNIHKNISHVFLFCFALGASFFFLSQLSQEVNYENFSGKDFIATIIVRTSYYENKTCDVIDKGKYIKLLEDNKVSVINLTREDISKMNSNNFKKEIVFSSGICMKE